MSTQEHRKFAFASDAEGANTFAVLSFSGIEGLSMPYRFEIDLVSEKADINLKAVAHKPCRLTIARSEGNIVFHGVPVSFEQMRQVHGYCFYRVIMVPRLELLKYTRHNQVFLNQPIPDILKAVIKDTGLGTDYFDFRLQGKYDPWEYICQYRESHFEFVSRWMEREGMYYFFEQHESSEKLIVTDSSKSHAVLPENKVLHYADVSGLTNEVREDVIHSLVCCQNIMPRTIKLKDYNYATPTLEIEGEADVSAESRGTVYIYGDHFRTSEEGKALASIRAQALLCRERVFHGESLVPYLRPGYVFDLKGHFRNDFNISFLTVRVQHSGDQTALMVDGIRDSLSRREERPYYRNSFTLIPSALQFRPERKTEKPRFYGTLNAKIDAEGSGKYAELDSQGRYKIKLPFDMGGKSGGKASSWLRMAQPYAGEDYGQHFPLHKGTEVLLTFIDGDPDRPLINGAVPNPSTPSPVVNANETLNVIKTAGNNRLEMQDQAGEERIRLSTPLEASFLQLGAPDEETDNMVLATKGSGLIKTGTWLKTETGHSSTKYSPEVGDCVVTTGHNLVHDVGENLEVLVGSDCNQTVSKDYACTVKNDMGLTVKGELKEEISGKHTLTLGKGQTNTITGDRKTTITGKDDVTITGDQSITITGKRKVKVLSDTDNKVFGGTTSMYASTKSDLYAAATSSIYAAAKSDINASGKFEASLGANVKLTASGSFELSASIKMAVGLALDIKSNAGLAITLHEALKIDKTKVKLDDADVDVGNSQVDLNNNTVTIVN